jgi:hypothetical protein
VTRARESSPGRRLCGVRRRGSTCEDPRSPRHRGTRWTDR